MKGLAFMKSRKEREKWSEEKLSHSTKTRGETMRDVANGDFSNFENLDKVMRNIVASQALKDFMGKYGDDLKISSATELCEKIKQSGKGVTPLMDPALRLAFSLARKAPTFSDGRRNSSDSWMRPCPPPSWWRL